MIQTDKFFVCKMADEHENDHVEDDHDDDKKGVTQIPLARVKRIAKSDPDLKTISAEAVFVIARATVCDNKNDNYLLIRSITLVKFEFWRENVCRYFLTAFCRSYS